METKNEKMTLDRLAEIMQREFGIINEKFEIIRKDFEKTDDRISSLEKELREKFDLVLDGQDKAAKWKENQEMEKTMGASASRRHQDELDDHEERIGVVENKLNIAGAEC